LWLFGSGGGGAQGERLEVGVIRAVFFDAGGTLLTPAEPVGRIYARLAQSRGWSAREEEMEKGFRAAWKKRRVEGLGSDGTLGREGWKRIVKESAMGLGMPADFAFEDYFSEVYDYFARPEAWQDFPEVDEVIRSVREKGIRVGMISNWDPRLRRVLGGFSWAEHLDLVVISEELGTEKPDPRIFREAEKRGGFSSGECALIGDDPISDRKGAESAGWQWALVNRPKCGLGEALASLRI
jgi:putative hydrolase of the HAD superfamily